MIEMRKAREEDLADGAALWTNVFGDDRQMQEDFRRLCAGGQPPLILRSDGALGAILSAAPMLLQCPNGRALAGWYLYALAAEPALRGQGFGAVLMGYAEELARLAGCDCAVLVPAQPSLFGYFEALGYEAAFYHRVWVPEAGPVPLAVPVPVAPGVYNVLRRGWLEGRAWVDWQDGPVAFQETLSIGSGGGLFRQDLPHGAGCIAVELSRDGTLVKELLCHPEDVDAAVGGLAGAFPGRSRVFLPAWLERGERRPWGMLRWLYGHPSPWVPRDQNGYFGLAFD